MYMFISAKFQKSLSSKIQDLWNIILDLSILLVYGHGPAWCTLYTYSNILDISQVLC